MNYNWKKEIHLVRGLPGEGKSTLALQLVNGKIDRVCENDKFWVDYDDEYDYDPSMAHIAGWWCWAETFRKLRQYDVVAVANTFRTREIILGYVEEAKKHKIKVYIHRPNNRWLGDVNECAKKNVHGATKDRIEKMKEEWEEITQEEIDNILFSDKDVKRKNMIKKDLTGEKCKVCKSGVYLERTFWDDMDGVLHCSKCWDQVKRYI